MKICEEEEGLAPTINLPLFSDEIRLSFVEAYTHCIYFAFALNLMQ